MLQILVTKQSVKLCMMQSYNSKRTELHRLQNNTCNHEQHGLSITLTDNTIRTENTLRQKSRWIMQRIDQCLTTFWMFMRFISI